MQGKNWLSGKGLRSRKGRERRYDRLLTSRVMSSSTIRFYLGTRPALLPDEMQRAPVSVIEFPPTVGSGDLICSGSMAYSYSSATLLHSEHEKFREALKRIETKAPRKSGSGTAAKLKTAKEKKLTMGWIQHSGLWFRVREAGPCTPESRCRRSV